MKKIIQDLIVTDNYWLNDYTFILVLRAKEKLPEILPGQFAEVRVDNHSDVFLRRPLSIHDVDYDKNTISFFIKAIGKGTWKLSELKIDEILNVIFPLGNSFSIKENSKVLLIGGGSGVAPFIFLAKALNKLGIKPKVLLGARAKDDIVLVDEFEKLGDVLITTEDGSQGEKGFVTDHSIFKDMNFDIIQTCGPDPMMKAIGKISQSKNIHCEVSLENLMACGVGACLCCITETHSGNVCVCTEGPVFNVNDLKW
ncbi:dihydroorotate dehydrogenase electron transfer subunit [Bacteroidota bacterium]